MRELKKFLFVTILIFPIIGFAFEKTDEIDITNCWQNSCLSKNVNSFTVNGDVEGQSWFDIVELGDHHTFFPLFNFHVKTKKQVNIKYGMQLLNDKKSVILDAVTVHDISSCMKAPDTGNSFCQVPVRIEEDIVNNTKYIRVQVKVLK